jgi:hypothetical protein
MSKKDLYNIGVLYENINTFNINNENIVRSTFMKLLLGKQLPISFTGYDGVHSGHGVFGDIEITFENEIITKNQVNSLVNAFLNGTLDIIGKNSKYVSNVKGLISDKLFDEYNLSNKHSSQVEDDYNKLGNLLKNFNELYNS